MESIKPFLKWAGGKTILLGHLNPILGNLSYERLVEPFVGAGSIFLGFYEKYEKFLLNDSNEHLMQAYQVIRDKFDEFITLYTRLATSYIKTADKEGFYYKIRNLFNSGKLVDIEQTASLIILNKTCFNGLFRVNRQGNFNVAWGKHEFPAFPNEEELKAVSKVLHNADLHCGDFEELEFSAGDLVYFDPPYQPLNGNFTSYTKDNFTFGDQVRLRDLILDLDSKGIAFAMSNSNFFEIKHWFPPEWVRLVSVARCISQDGTNRNDAKEVIVSNRWK